MQYYIKKWVNLFLPALLIAMPVYAELGRQVIYLFGDDRALVLVGNKCQGTVFYVDNKQKFATQVTSGFKVSLFPFIHPSKKYIAIPYRDLSGLMVSKDYGRTFEDASFSPGGGPTGMSDATPEVSDVVSFTVVDDQGFFLTKQNYIYLSSKPFGNRWGLDYVALDAIPELVYKDRENFQNLPTSVPEVKDYKGWTHMQCDPTR
ncbi:T6SS immunity protein Tli3 family protein [Limnobaculum parvum]|uniref:Tli3-like domain-containing protein n=1 Tax=Limnobaculum parvum TaxID=2172103 RepID=A0A2Y9U0D5_9GAMM|nr:hypothetical protein [Limnobaculum parvum]AWH89427.1 hypothetical protein HYN51_13230 [Limnobaculum parvum]